MIKRTLEKALLKDAQKSPVLAILGPRQSGKTTLARATFAHHAYVTLEELDMREFAIKDPRGFLAEYNTNPGVIIDEIQHAPDLLSYIQTQVDFNYRPGFYILIGSQNFLITQTISQTLAGRISLHTLLPLSLQELKKAQLLSTSDSATMYSGFYPSIYSKQYDPTEWYTDYIKNYIERDVRTISNITDLLTFKRFLKLCAGHVGQLINFSALATDCGVSYNTIKAWLSVLEASYIVFFLQPYYKNFNKRLVKTPKLYFYDSGLACALLDIESETQLKSHYARGALFESMIIAEIYKAFYNHDKNPHLYFWRDHTGHEIDCLIERGEELFPLEIKSSKTVNQHFFDALNFWNALSGNPAKNSLIVYGGEHNQTRSLGTFVAWNNTAESIMRFIIGHY